MDRNPAHRGDGLTSPPSEPAALIDGRDQRCSLDRTLHGVEVMTACLESGETGAFVTMQTTCTRPAALGLDEARALLA